MMRPQPRAAIAGPNCWPSRNGAVRFTATERSHSSTLSTDSGGLRLTPAALIKMSGSPNISVICSQARLIPPRSPRSAQTRPTADPADRSSLTVSSSAAARRAASTTLAPAPASALAIALPMPELPPVTTAIRPSREKSRCR